MKEYFDILEWSVRERGFHPEGMRVAESLTSAGNGYMGLRGNFEEDYSGDTLRGTYLGGVWFPDRTRVGWWKNGYPPYFGKAINAMNLIGMHITVGGVLLDAAQLQVEDFSRELCMQNGLLTRQMTYVLPQGRVRLDARRFVSMAQKELLVSRIELRADFAADVCMEAFLDGNVRNEDSNHGETFWETVAQEADERSAFLVSRTKENPFGTPRFTVAATQGVHCLQMRFACACAKDGVTSQRFEGALAPGETLVFERVVAVYTDRDHPADELVPLAQASVRTGDYSSHFCAHERAWADKWATADVRIAGDIAAQQGIRFNLFHLLCTYTGADERLNIGPKGFTGEKYGGATYWDTEAYCLPVYMAICGQKVARQLLLYRYKQLAGAYHNARMQGLPGALYPMVTFTGEECHNEWEITFEEIHRNGAIAHAIFNYVSYTGDIDYTKREGLDVLVGIARFFAGRVHLCKRTGQYMIHGVTGPNEYENNVANNWYTNRMAAWCLNFCREAAQLAGAERCADLNITESELNRFRDIAASMYLPEDRELGIFVQHDTFLDKDIMPAAAIPEEERPINQHWSWDRILRSCFIKQADVLQGLYFLGHLYDMDTKKRNFDFYEPMTVHESSLSPCVHSILAAELGYYEKAVALYKRTARLDLDNINNDTQDGLHVTSMSGSWLAIAQGFAGMRTARGLHFSPFLPEGWEGYDFRFTYRERVIHIAVCAKCVTFTLESGAPIELTVYNKREELRKNAKLSILRQG